MLAADHVPPDRYSNRVLQVPTNSQNRRKLPIDAHRKWNVTSRATDNAFAASAYPNHGIIAGSGNWPVVQDEDIGDAVETLQRLIISRRNRLFTAIAAGGDDWPLALPHQQMMQR